MSSANPTPQTLTAKVSTVLNHEGFPHHGFTALTTPVSIHLYEAWLANGYQGEMQYLERHLEQKRSPESLLPRAQSAIVVTQNYVPHPAPAPAWPVADQLWIASYARGRDYHHFLKEGLERVIRSLKAQFPGEEFVCFADSSPVLERDLAARAGLGWIGKNTCLLSRDRGSLFLIGEIYTTLAFETAQLQTRDHCGSCTRCLEICPTGALVNPRELDARKCISYLTIESREVPDVHLREKIGGWFFGCDLCQTVCPWNQKVYSRERLQALHPEPNSDRQALIRDLSWILSSSHRGLEKAFRGTPLLRAGGFGLKRNALIVCANLGIIECLGEVEKLIERENENEASNKKLLELARWTRDQLSAK